ncbi:PAS domain-containing sensor histidine kinase [Legionella sp. km772]|uniref:sensor histidine kinase n=1 Tax=Legionella sp. km772 TaxID=2498111 RepID=UPI000F8E5B00|nr:ATP-binding protein [Legionella sp. km772]RUR10848.1 two-component sensor histidine kinase [Legionella sp. km772]
MLKQIRYPENRQWHLLLIYNLYRILSVFLFVGMYSYAPNPVSYTHLFFTLLIIYFILTLIFLFCGYTRIFSFDKQVFISGTIDVMALAAMLSLISNMRSGQGILLNVTVAALSILVPGRLAVFFAALASCLLLCGNIVQLLLYNQKDLGNFYYSGIYGAGFFATALTAWYLSNWARMSENLARKRSDELVGMQRINEYIVERLHSGIIYVDETEEIMLINSAARDFLSLSNRHHTPHLEEISKPLSEKFHSFLIKNKQKEHIAQAIIEDPLLRVHFFSIALADKPAVLIILEDMTYIAQQAQQLKLAALGRFSASIAHELRNPLGAIAHAAQLLGEEVRLSKEDQRLKELIVNNCERMNGVIKNVLQLSRREKSKPQVNEIQAFLEQFKHTFCHNNPCDLIIKVPKNKLVIVFDKSQLEQILIILCENSLKHGKDEHGEAHIVITAKATASTIMLTISDSGPGVPLELQDTIFEPFFTTLRQGTGMGLFIARDLCEINQARLTLVKGSKKGCVFSIIQNTSDEILL